MQLSSCWKKIEKNANFWRKNYFGLFFLVLTNMTNVREHYIGAHPVFDRYCASYMIVSLGPKKSRTKFFKIKSIVPKKRLLPFFFWSYPLWQISSKLLLDSTRFYGIYGASYSIISLTQKSLLKTQIFEKKGKFSSEKNILGYFFSYYRTWQTSWKNLKGYTK